MSFYRFLKDPARRAMWISAVGRKNWMPNTYSWICSPYFASGEKSDDPLSAGYVPTLFAHTGSPQAESSRRPVEILKKSGRKM